MKREISVFLGDHEAVDYIFTEDEIGAPNTRDCFTLARQMLLDMGIPEGTIYEFRLKDGSSPLATDKGIL